MTLKGLIKNFTKGQKKAKIPNLYVRFLMKIIVDLHEESILFSSLEPKMFKLVPRSHLAQSFVSTFL